MALEERIQLFPHPPPQLVLELEDRTGNGNVEENDLFDIMHQLREEYVGRVALIVEARYTRDKKHRVYITGSEPFEIRRSRRYLEEQYQGLEIFYLPIPDLEVDRYDI